MTYSVLFESHADQDMSLETLRMLQGLHLCVIRIGDAEADWSSRCPKIPLVTLGTCPGDFTSLGLFGFRGWVALLPPEHGSVEAFAEAGAYAALRLPVERSSLISAVSRCLCGLDATPASFQHPSAGLSAAYEYAVPA